MCEVMARCNQVTNEAANKRSVQQNEMFAKMAASMVEASLARERGEQMRFEQSQKDRDEELKDRDEERKDRDEEQKDRNEERWTRIMKDPDMPEDVKALAKSRLMASGSRLMESVFQ
jgi:hypothetical protein